MLQAPQLILADSVREDVQIARVPVWAVVLYLTVWSVPNNADRIAYGLVESAPRILRSVSAIVGQWRARSL